MADQRLAYLIDDDLDFCLQQRLRLEALGFRVEEAHDSRAAAALLAAGRPDLIVQDLMMDEPDSGFILCHRAKRLYPGVPIVMVTAVGAETGIDFDAATREERAWIKADRVLAKPIRAQQLEAAVRQLLPG